jgi:hypothetical protein
MRRELPVTLCCITGGEHNAKGEFEGEGTVA